jgi:hypothetical protein
MLLLINHRRVLDQESQANKQEAVQRDRLEQLERMVQCQTEKLDSLEFLVHTLIAANSSQKLNNQSSTDSVTGRPPRDSVRYHSEDDSPSRDWTRVNTLVEELQFPKNSDIQA